MKNGNEKTEEELAQAQLKDSIESINRQLKQISRKLHKNPEMPQEKKEELNKIYDNLLSIRRKMESSQ